MKGLIVACLLAIPALGQSTRSTAVPVTSVSGESWLNHIHRAFEQTSMGKTYRLGPPLPIGLQAPLELSRERSADAITKTVTLRGADLYRLNCWACHGEFGLGAPPEINSVINPTRATSTQLVMERMRNLGMEMTRAEAAQLAQQSKTALLQRIHSGGTDMPAFPHLSEPEVHAIVNYLRHLAGIPGAEEQQALVKESRIRVGEHLVKSTCHICHNASGPNPGPKQLFDGVIPPLGTLTTRTSLAEFDRKIRHGAPIIMGTPPSAFRGRMPVFYYLTEEEVADAYLYLTVYPPQEFPDPAIPGIEQKQRTREIVKVEFNVPTTNVAPVANARGSTMIVFQAGAEIFVALLLTGGLWFTFHEVIKATTVTKRTEVLMMNPRILSQRGSPPDAQPGANATSNERGLSEPGDFNDGPAFRDDDYRTFESSWFSRWIEGEDEAA